MEYDKRLLDLMKFLDEQITKLNKLTKNMNKDYSITCPINLKSILSDSNEVCLGVTGDIDTTTDLLALHKLTLLANEEMLDKEEQDDNSIFGEFDIFKP